MKKIYINKLLNLHKNKGSKDSIGGFHFNEKTQKINNLLNIHHTGLGNTLFEISTHLAFCWDNNYNYSFPDINLLYEKVPEYPKNTIYRNLNIKKYDNYKIINNRKYIYKYFHKYRNKLKSIFSIDDTTLNFINNNILININKPTVSMHVRRGDFTFIAKKWNPEYITKKSYYIEAYNLMKKKLNTNFHLLIISDDIEWCKKNLIFDNTKYINNLDYIDLWIMTLCDHNIISSSTFSWWGAYLNNNFEKNIVICPRKSIHKEKKNIDKCNINFYPKYWSIIDDIVK